jgi:Prolyl oligopeptidase family
MKILMIAVFAAAVISAAPLSPRQANKTIDAAFEQFWAAASPSQAESAAKELIRQGVSFEDVWKRLKAGRHYVAYPGGIVTLKNATKDGATHFFSVNVPRNYDPARAYPLRFQLHGGVSGRTDNQPRGTGSIGQLAGAPDQFYVLPYAWNRAPWWSEDQVLNFAAMVDQVKRTYNIDENRVVVSGVSDGGTGSYYLAMRDTTPFAAFLPLNGFLLLLAEDLIDDSLAFPSNLINKPFFVVNGGRDPLYPAEIVDPTIRDLVAAGVDVAYHPQPNAGHDTSWWPQMKTPFEQFVKEHPRVPHPEHVTWETNDLDHNRAHWIVIDKFMVNDRRSSLLLGPTPLEPYFRKKPSGRVSAFRSGNQIVAMTKGVAQFTVLLSPDVFDFTQPVEVIVNGHPAFTGNIARNVDTLLHWAARDNDRTMLYGAELQIEVKP